MLAGRGRRLGSGAMVVTTGAPAFPAVHDARAADGPYAAAATTVWPLPVIAVGRPLT